MFPEFILKISPVWIVLELSNWPTNRMFPLVDASATKQCVTVLSVPVDAENSILLVLLQVWVSELADVNVQFAAVTCYLAYAPNVASVKEPASASDTAVAKPTKIESPSVAKDPALFLKIKLRSLFSR